MPHGNKKSRASNAKKKGKQNRPTPSGLTSGSCQPPGSAVEEQRTSEPIVTPRMDLPSLRSLNNVGEAARDPNQASFSHPDHAGDSLYIRSKKSTQRSKDSLQSMVPASIFHSDNVHSLMAAAEYVIDHDMAVDNQLFDDLKVAISVRRYVAKHKYGGGDEGHNYFIAVLVYCWSVLVQKRPRRMVATIRMKGPQSSTAKFSNQFAGLSVAEEDDANDEDEVDLPRVPQPRPQETVPTRLTLQELISGTDRMNIILFLSALDELMGFNAQQFAKLKEESARIQSERNEPADVIIENMMEAAVATNFAIQQVASLELMFIHDHPHLNTVYRVFANLVLPDFVRHLTVVVTKKSPIANQFTERHAVEFLGDAMECTFRNKSDPHNKNDTLVKDFLDQWQFADEPANLVDPEADMSVKSIFDSVNAVVALEVPLHQEMTAGLGWLRDSVRMTSHSWIPEVHIGKNRSITHTIRLLQGLSNVIPLCGGHLDAQKKGFFGPEWNERKHVSRIPIEMDHLLMGDIIPSLFNLCIEGILASDLPFQDELLTAFVHIKSFVKYPERPVSWSLAFVFHSILTSIFEVQGSNHFTFLAETAKSSFGKYFDQLEGTLKWHPTTIESRPPIVETNIRTLLSLRLLVHDNLKRKESQITRAVWNPYCAGSFLLYTAYYGNLEGGTSLVDSVAQLRATLHLYNALLQLRAIRPGQIELLDWVYETFKDCKSIWEGPLPVRGQFKTRWWIAFGMKPQLARKMGSAAQKKSSPCDDPTRKMTPIVLEKLSKSFRRICHRDFHDVVDKYHTESQRKSNKSSLYQFAVRVNDTLDALTDDHRLLATNLIQLGNYLNQFYISLFNVWGWMRIVDELVGSASAEAKYGRRTDFRRVSPNSWEASDDNMKYQTMSHLFAEKALGPLDAGDALVASRCAEFMVVYFQTVPPRCVTWFTPTNEEYR